MPERPTLRFVVLSTQRSGSTWLCDVLNNSGRGAKVYGELFIPARHDWDVGPDDRPRFALSETPGPRPLSVFRYLKALFAQPVPVGFKLMYSQLRLFPEVFAYLVARRVPVVHLVRRNHFDVFLSGQTAHALGRGHAFEDEEGSEDDARRSVQVTLDAEEAVRRMKALRRHKAVMRRLLRLVRQPHVEVCYEALCEDEAEWQRAWSFLGIEPEVARPVSSLTKRTARSHRDVIRNYDEVRRRLAETDFAPLIR